MPLLSRTPFPFASLRCSLQLPPCPLPHTPLPPPVAPPPPGRVPRYSLFTAFTRLAREQGVAGLWRGNAPYLLRHVPSIR